MSLNKKPSQTIVAFCGPSPCGKSTLIEKILEEYEDKKDYFSVIKLYNHMYPENKRPKITMRGRTISNLDLKESTDWDSFYDEIARENAPIVFLDGSIIFADQRSHQIVDICVTMEFDFTKDYDIALTRRVKRSRRFQNQSVPSDYLQNTWSNYLNYYCTYFHDIVWPEMIKHPEYRNPVNWNKPILTLSATSDIKLNTLKTKNFIYQYIHSYLD